MQSHREVYERGGEAAYKNPVISAMHSDAIELMPIVEQIADRTWPDWRDHLREHSFVGWEYDSLAQIAAQLLAMLRRKDELEQNLGETGPALSVSTMHPDAWDASQSLWENGHFGETVSAAAKSVNAGTASKG